MAEISGANVEWKKINQVHHESLLRDHTLHLTQLKLVSAGVQDVETLQSGFARVTNARQ
jgi:hypothetical protein